MHVDQNDYPLTQCLCSLRASVASCQDSSCQDLENIGAGVILKCMTEYPETKLKIPSVSAVLSDPMQQRLYESMEKRLKPMESAKSIPLSENPGVERNHVV